MRGSRSWPRPRRWPNGSGPSGCRTTATPGSAQSLLIVPHGSLGQLPFGVLVTKPGAVAAGGLQFEGYRSTAWFLERAAITQLPSVNTLASLRSVQRARAPSKPFIGFGDPVFGMQQVATAAALDAGSTKTRSAPLKARNAMSAKLAELIQLPDTAEVLAVVVIFAAGLLGILWVPAGLLLTSGAERIGLDSAFAFAFFNLGWAGGFTVGAAGGGALA